MKKAIGLTANISEFRPNLPQTKHLNYFMGTNPVYMAGGGDVKAGIPNYPDVNVTRGFLPAALGFDDGGEADKDTVTKIYDFIFVKALRFDVCLPYVKPFLRKEGKFILSCSRRFQNPEEIPGFFVQQEISYLLPFDCGERVLLVLCPID